MQNTGPVRSQQDPSRSRSHSGNQPDASHKAKQELPPTSSKALTRKKQNHLPRAGEMDPENQDFPERRPQNTGVGKQAVQAVCGAGAGGSSRPTLPGGEGREPFPKPRALGLPDSPLRRQLPIR